STARTNTAGGPTLPGRHEPGRAGGRVVPPVVQQRVRGAAAPRAAVDRGALGAGRPLDMRGGRGEAMWRPVQQAAERVLVCHLHLPLSISDRETLALIECRGEVPNWR